MTLAAVNRLHIWLSFTAHSEIDTVDDIDQLCEKLVFTFAGMEANWLG